MTVLDPALSRLIEQSKRRFPVNDNEDPETRYWRTKLGLSREEFDREVE